MRTRGLVSIVSGLVLIMAMGISCKKRSEEGQPEESAPKTTEPTDQAQPGGQEQPGTTAPAPDQGQQNQGQGDQMGGGTAPMGQDAAACPVTVPNTKVEVSNTQDGVALSFTTSESDKVDELRQKVNALAEQYQSQPSGGQMMWQHMGQGQGKGMGQQQGMGQQGQGQMPEVTARIEDAGNGSRIVLTPKDASQLDALRKEVRSQQQKMQSGQCWSWGGQGGSQTQPGQEQQTGPGQQGQEGAR